ncbi:hypothetical protein QYM36_011427 [Artemia franciscana]|uniref:DNA 3'-5' helicase n=1 Tax=Artemia franciscana TaxID=6661 RepID=A0AA88HNH1_ARTSF|nr:hypothetical protein QYM36_011427 [Artemia franciscana]
MIDEEISALSQANNFGQLEEKKMNKMEFGNHLYDKVMKFVKLDNETEVLKELETMAKNDITMKIRSLLQDNLDELVSGYSAIGLQVNGQKTEFLVYSSAKQEAPAQTVSVNGAIIAPSSSLKYLGLMFCRDKKTTRTLCLDTLVSNLRSPKQTKVFDKFPLPRIDEILDHIQNKNKIFTTLDSTQGYHQVKIAEDEVFKSLEGSVDWVENWSEAAKKITGTVNGQLAIVYFSYAWEANAAYSVISSLGVKAAAFTGEYSSLDKNGIHGAMRNVEIEILCATTAYGCGLNLPDVHCVVCFGLPKNMSSWMQEQGRTGRDGQPARAIILLNKKYDTNRCVFWLDKPSDGDEKSMLTDFMDVLKYAYSGFSGLCLRKFQVKYLGENLPQDNAQNCCQSCDDQSFQDVSREIRYIFEGRFLKEEKMGDPHDDHNFTNNLEKLDKNCTVLAWIQYKNQIKGRMTPGAKLLVARILKKELGNYGTIIEAPGPGGSMVIQTRAPTTPDMITLQKIKFNNNEIIFEKYDKEKADNFKNNIIGKKDGSKQGNKTGLGVWFENRNFSIKERLPDESSIFQAEIKAIEIAITEIQNTETPDSFLICSDSLSSLLYLANYQVSPTKEMAKISQMIKTLQERNFTIKIIWIPSHIGLYGNEMADMMAKESLTQQISLLTTNHPVEIKKRIKEHLIKEEHLLFKNKCKNKYQKIVKDNFITKNLIHPNKNIANTIFRIRTGHNKTNASLFRWKITTSPLCDLCKIDEDAEHLIMNCSKYNQERHLLEKNVKNNAGGNFDYNEIIGITETGKQESMTRMLGLFLRETKLLDYI